MSEDLSCSYEIQSVPCLKSARKNISLVIDSDQRSFFFSRIRMKNCYDVDVIDT